MGLFGSKCVRCGESRTRHTYEGLPTCEPCEQLLETKKQAANEDPRTCPMDSKTMEKDIVLNIVVDRCPTCKGVWLDGGELELIRSAVAEGAAMDLARAIVIYP